mgnify:CR=1 FL=1|jgi:hypothetical protein
MNDYQLVLMLIIIYIVNYIHIMYKRIYYIYDYITFKGDDGHIHKVKNYFKKPLLVFDNRR